MRLPELRNTLRFNLTEQAFVPTEVLLHAIFGSEAVLLIQQALPLQVRRKVVVVGEVEAFFQVAADFLDDIADLLLHLTVVLLLFLVQFRRVVGSDGNSLLRLLFDDQLR